MNKYQKDYEGWSPVSIQTQSLALRAMRKRKPQETQALALASSQSWLPLLRPSIPIGWRLRLLREIANASDCVWMETGLDREASEKTWAVGCPCGGHDDGGGSAVLRRWLDGTHDGRRRQHVMHTDVAHLPTTRDSKSCRVPRQRSRPATSFNLCTWQLVALQNQTNPTAAHDIRRSIALYTLRLKIMRNVRYTLNNTDRSVT